MRWGGKRGRGKAFLGKGSVFTGRLLFTGLIRLDGAFRGEIDGEGTLVIGEEADIEARITADCLEIGGRVRGDLQARRRCTIRTTGRVAGTIQTPALVVAEGAVLEGNARMPAHGTAWRPEKPPSGVL